MPAKRKDEKEKNGLWAADFLSSSRMMYILYVAILILAVLVVYFAITEYIIYSSGLPRDDFTLTVTDNAVQSFADGQHPVLVISASSRQSSLIQFRLLSAKHKEHYSSGEYVNNYTALAILPKDAFSTQFNITAASYDKKGNVLMRIATATTKDKPKEQDVTFSIK
jgi:hypothetical protein